MFRKQSTDTGLDAIRRKKYLFGVTGTGSDHGLFAVAAHLTDHPVVAELALEEAETRGMNMSLLRELIDMVD